MTLPPMPTISPRIVLALSVVALVFFLCMKIFNTAIPVSGHDVALVVIGGIITKFGTVIDFFFGSKQPEPNTTSVTTPPEPTP